MVLVLGFVPMQAWAQGAAASVSVNGTVVGTYETLEDAFEAVDLCDAEDNVVITLLQDITVEQSCDVYSGVFTIDLNGYEMNNAEDGYCVLQIYNADTTIVDSVGTGLISGKENAIVSRGGSLTITGGSFTADSSAIYANSCESVTITGGSLGATNVSAHIRPPLKSPAAASTPMVTISTAGTVTFPLPAVFSARTTAICVLMTVLWY